MFENTEISFQSKSEKDLKILSPFINEINAIFCNLSELSDLFQNLIFVVVSEFLYLFHNDYSCFFIFV